MNAKIRRLLIVTLVLALLIPSFVVASADYYVYIRATASVTVRSSPSLSGRELGTLSKGTTAEYADKSSYDSRDVEWYKIYYDGGTGWVSSTYSERVNASNNGYHYDDPRTSSSGSYIRATASLNVRSSPSTSGKSLGTLSEGTTATYLGVISTDRRGVDWYKIRYDGSTAWVSSTYCVLVDDNDDYYDYRDFSDYEEPSEWRKSGSYVRATSSLNVRSSPSTSGKQLGTLSEGTTATYLGYVSTDSRGVDWYKISYDGSSAWVSSTYSVLVKNAEPAPTKRTTSSYIVATGGDLTVRKSPSLSGTRLGTLFEGDTATYLGSKSTDDRGVVWYKISYDGSTGWVSSKYAKLYS